MQVAPDLLQRLAAHPWPGNLRQYASVLPVRKFEVFTCPRAKSAKLAKLNAPREARFK